MFIGRFYIITLKVMGEMRKFILQGVFSGLTDRRPPDGLLDLRHNPNLGRFNSL
jgi:hypothetical protein